MVASDILSTVGESHLRVLLAIVIALHASSHHIPACVVVICWIEHLMAIMMVVHESSHICLIVSQVVWSVMPVVCWVVVPVPW